jgi:nickel/cobalt transporter (NicO) family protein
MKRLLACLLCAVAFQATAVAHVLDQYLQVAQIALEPGVVHVELRLIPGVQVADRIFALIDVNGDGQISPAEGQAYVQLVLQNVFLEVDGRRSPLALTRVQFPSRSQMNEGIGAIRLELTAVAALGVAGNHQLSFRNDHLPELGAYLANAMIPATDAIKITGQQRDALQHGLQVNFRVLSSDAPAWPRWTAVLLFGLCPVMLFPRWRRLRTLAAAFRR